VSHIGVHHTIGGGGEDDGDDRSMESGGGEEMTVYIRHVDVDLRCDQTHDQSSVDDVDHNGEREAGSDDIGGPATLHTTTTMTLQG
jgi:hypothetical protein